MSVTVINNGRALRQLQRLRAIAEKPPLRLRREWVVRKKKSTVRGRLLLAVTAAIVGGFVCVWMT